MSKFDIDNLLNDQIDVIREIGNIGAGNATTALSKMLNCKVDMLVPKVKLLGFTEIANCLGSEEKIMASVYVNIRGDINGGIMFLQDTSSANNIIRRILGQEVKNGFDYTDIQRSALKEVGNIISASYLNSLSKMTGLKIRTSVPALSVDMIGAMLSVPAIEFGKVSDNIVLIESKFTNELEVDGYFVLFPEVESFEKILGALGVGL